MLKVKNRLFLKTVKTNVLIFITKDRIHTHKMEKPTKYLDKEKEII